MIGGAPLGDGVGVQKGKTGRVWARLRWEVFAGQRVMRGVLGGVAGSVAAVVQFFGFMSFAGTETNQGGGGENRRRPPINGSHARETTRRTGNGARGNGVA